MVDILQSSFFCIKRIENTFFNSNTYIISGINNSVWLVDCGDYYKIKEYIGIKSISGILLTHSHADHIYGINELLCDFPSAKIYTNNFGRMALSEPRFNLTKYHEEVRDFVIDSVANINVIDEESEFELFPNINVKVLETPGHDASCLSYIVGEYLFTGDSYIPSVKLTAKFPFSNKIKAKEQYNRLKLLESDYIICPGHGNIVDNRLKHY